MLECQIRYRLAQIAVVMHDLIDRKALLQELAAVQRGSGPHLRRYRAATTGGSGNLAAFHGLRSLLDLECLDQLIQEQRNPVCELGMGHSGRGPLSHLEAAALY